ncbi:glycosyltransferase [Candidatus Shapirobacteria bacterium]|nr:glycosyltransferase [Candidatus Shapirobacteria bacterium]
MNKLKIAIFYDWLNNWGGAERVLLNLLTLYPQAEIYTLVHDPKKTSWLPSHFKIHTSFLNKLPFSKTNPIFYTPLYNFAIEQFDFSSYDIVISTTTTVGHGLLTSPQTLFVCYFHNINRYVYYTPGVYQLLIPLLALYKKIDQVLIRRPDAYFCNSQTVAKRLQKAYGINPIIINPGINLSHFTTPLVKSNSESYFLIVGRQVPHKKIDIAIKCFENNPSLKLIIAGSGRDHSRLTKLALRCRNIQFIDQPSDQELLNLYQNASALICPQYEDYGLTPIEAQACGTPVIAYGRGGNLETTIKNKTAVYFYHQTPVSLQIAIKKFQQKRFDPFVCQQNTLRFTDNTFMLNFSDQLQKLWTKK